MKKQTKVVVSVLLWSADKLLLLKRKKDFEGLSMGKNLWDLPGGKLNFGEQPKEALQRELEEETGYIRLNKSLSLIDVLSYTVQDSGTTVHRINPVYSMEYEQISSITLGEEHSEYRLANDITETGALEMIPEIKAFIVFQMQHRNLM